MSRKKYTHFHEYTKISEKLYRCAVPGCPSAISGGNAFMIGRVAQCPFCPETFIISSEHLRNTRLHCGKCTINGKPIERIAAPVIIPDIKEEITQKEMDIFSAIPESISQGENKT